MLPWSILLYFGVPILAMAQAPQSPNVQEQRTAMSKLHFLVGTWSGHARIWRGPDTSTELTQTEQVAYKLDSLLLSIEGSGKNTSNGKPELQALALISYDDAAGVYRMRAFNDGRWLESELQLDPSGTTLHWGFTLGQMKTHSTLRVTDGREWTELHEAELAPGTRRKFMELTVSRQP